MVVQIHTSWSGMEGAQPRAMHRQLLRTSYGNAGYLLTNNTNIYPLLNMQIDGAGVQTPYSVRTTPFRRAMNAGDIFGTVNKPASTDVLPKPSNQVYPRKSSSFSWNILGGGVNQVSDGSAYVGNPKYVYDGADYVRFKKLQAINRNYNDSNFGGNDHSAQQSAYRRTHL